MAFVFLHIFKFFIYGHSVWRHYSLPFCAASCVCMYQLVTLTSVIEGSQYRVPHCWICRCRFHPI